MRGDLLAKLGRVEEAREEFGRAAAMTGNERERALFRARAALPAVGLRLERAGESPHRLHVGDIGSKRGLVC